VSLQPLEPGPQSFVVDPPIHPQLARGLNALRNRHPEWVDDSWRHMSSDGRDLSGDSVFYGVTEDGTKFIRDAMAALPDSFEDFDESVLEPSEIFRMSINPDQHKPLLRILMGLHKAYPGYVNRIYTASSAWDTGFEMSGKGASVIGFAILQALDAARIEG